MPDILRFSRYACAVLAYNVFVVLWGAYVRATGSGAGCGSHWPLCNGQVAPSSPGLETVIEFTHRVTSGVSLILVAALLVWAVRAFPKGHRARLAAWLSMGFLLVEAALGAGLVLFDFVGQNASPARAGYLAAHLVNTQLLIAALAATAWFATHKLAGGRAPASVWTALPVVLLVSATGAVAALGDTLIAGAAGRELSAAAAALVELRVLHPLLAVAGGFWVLSAAVSAIRWNPAARVAGWTTAGLVLAQLAAGTLNIALLAPVWMQMVHLLLANALWIALVLTHLTSVRAKDFQS